jgi:hypothetical protein
MEKIKKWLQSNTPDYNAGVLLFAQHSRNRSLLHYFTRKGEVAMFKLRYELGKIAGSQQSAVGSRQSAVGSRSRQSAVNAVKLPTANRQLPTATVPPERQLPANINPADLPEHLRILYDKNVEDYKLLRGAHAAMAVAKTKNERKKLRREIAKLDDAIEKHWALIDEWLATGKLPTATANCQLPTGSLTPQEVNTYRTYISRGLAEPDKLTDEKRATMQERILSLIADGQKFDDETITKLTALGFEIE